MDKRSSAFFAPNYILESNGIACGDKVTIYAFEESEKLYFSFICDACSLCKQMAKYLEDNLSGSSKDAISFRIEEIFKENFRIGSLQGQNNISLDRINCVRSPILLLQHLLASIKKAPKGDTRQNKNLACDACVQSREVNWEIPGCVIKNTPFLEKNRESLSDTYEVFLQQCGLAGNGKFILKNLQYFSNDQILEKRNKLIKKLRLAAPIYNNLLEIGHIEIDPFIKRTVLAQYTSLQIAETETTVIDTFISKNQLKISPVKGQKTKTYYPQEKFRVHMDFDYLAATENDAFILLDFLINKRDFRFVIGGSVPFSFKAILNNGTEILTGHIHLEKILQDQYQVVIDINIGSFPVGRVGAIKCSPDGGVAIEDEICITLAHLFKHEYAFMKDLNDLYYCLKSDLYQKDTLLKKIEQYGLTNEFISAINFLKEHFSIEGFESIDAPFRNECNFEQWPYSHESHFLLKKWLLEKACQQRFGQNEAMSEIESQLNNASGKIYTKQYAMICRYLNRRTYLYPIVIFTSFLRFNDTHKINDAFIIHKHIAILPIGLFLIEMEGINEISRDEMLFEIDEIINQYSISKDVFNFNYAMEARKDLWLY